MGEACYGESSGDGQGDEKIHNEDPKKWGREMKPSGTPRRLRSLFWLPDSRVQSVPLVMLFCWTVAGEGFSQHFEIGHFVYIEYAPIGKAAGAALPSNLIGQQTGLSVLHAVVVWLSDSELALIYEADVVACVDRVQ